jgi:hypothetical protein
MKRARSVLSDFLIGEKRIPQPMRWFHFMYFVDWAIVIILFVIPGIYGVVVKPRDRYLPLNDSRYFLTYLN